jgi:hypothetical protein
MILINEKLDTENCVNIDDISTYISMNHCTLRTIQLDQFETATSLPLQTQHMMKIIDYIDVIKS